MFDASTLVRDEVGEDYTLKVISDVDDDNMVIVRTQYITQSVFIPGIFEMGGGEFPTKKTYNPPNSCQVVCSIFFGRENELQIYQIYDRNFLLMDNKHRKLFVVKHSKGCKFMPKMWARRLYISITTQLSYNSALFP